MNSKPLGLIVCIPTRGAVSIETMLCLRENFTESAKIGPVSYGKPLDTDKGILIFVAAVFGLALIFGAMHYYRLNVAHEPSSWYMVESDFIDQDSTGHDHYYDWLAGGPYKTKELCLPHAVTDDQGCHLLLDSEAAKMPMEPR